MTFVEKARQILSQDARVARCKQRLSKSFAGARFSSSKPSRSGCARRYTVRRTLFAR
jgi:hypothetical protein